MWWIIMKLWSWSPEDELCFLSMTWPFLCCHHEADICGFEWNITTTTRWIVIKFGSDSHVCLRMNSDNFDDSPDFSSDTVNSLYLSVLQKKTSTKQNPDPPRTHPVQHCNTRTVKGAAHSRCCDHPQPETWVYCGIRYVSLISVS